MLASEATVREQAQRVQQLREQVDEEGMEIHEDGSVRPRVVVASAEALEDAIEDEVGPDEDGDAAGQAELALPAAIAGGAEIDIPQLRERIHELRAAIRALGPVNLEALEDLSEEQERHEFLTGQIDDLEAAEAELREAIRDLRRLIRERFVETFDQVNTRFGEYFTRFFGGGHAELRLLVNDEEPESEPGVEIVAQPPGKRISNLNILSGGERSMTSVALLFALLSVNPAPMVVLDEVDAALDEANVGRFRRHASRVASAQPVRRHLPQPRHDRGRRCDLRCLDGRRLFLAGTVATRRAGGRGGSGVAARSNLGVPAWS